MPTVVPNLWFDAEALEAAELHTSIFPDSEIVRDDLPRRPEPVLQPPALQLLPALAQGGRRCCGW